MRPTNITNYNSALLRPMQKSAVLIGISSPRSAPVRIHSLSITPKHSPFASHMETPLGKHTCDRQRGIGWGGNADSRGWVLLSPVNEGGNILP
jgi:hypothetical protein